MAKVERFEFNHTTAALGSRQMLPWLPLILERNGIEVDADGLLDTGSTVNVMPYNLGLSLGASWEQAMYGIHLAGILRMLNAG